MSEPGFVPLLNRELGGAITVNVFAGLSTFALFSVACRVIWLAIRQKLSLGTSESREYIFFNTQLGHYAACLLIANAFVDVAGLIGVRWTIDKGITDGGLCTVQAILMQIGNWSTAYFTVTIAVHTFNSLVLKRRQSVLLAGSVISIGWISAGILAAGPFVDPSRYKFGPGYGADGLSCGVRSVYLKAQFFFHLLPIFLASIMSAILYSLIFLVLRGTLNIRGGIKLTLDPQERWVAGKVVEHYPRFVARIARNMLWYPVAYIALLVPYSVTRLLAISGFTVAFESKIFAYTCWSMLGVVNVLLLYNTFRVLQPAIDTPSQRESSMSFGSKGMLRSALSQSAEEKSSWDEKIDQYRYPTPSYRSPTIASFGQVSPQSSVQPLLPVYPERSASVQSYYSYPSSPSIGRAITPVNDLQRTVTPPKRAVQKLSPTVARALAEHTRQGSTDSLGLPAAPRRTRSPVLHKPSIEHMHTVNGTWSPVQRDLPRQPSTRTFGSGSPRNRANAELTLDYDPTNWDSRQTATASSSPNGYGRPLLSAMNSGFSSPGTPHSPSSPRPLPNPPRHSRSFSAVPAISPAPTGRQRPVLVSRHGSIGNSSESGHTPQNSSQAGINYA
ncbi:hypothetical protein LshimejAT787_0803700 [Lyophyllum shimeji]|uniref:G-protein coupled receptors family 1 profile domain-containing protein n=1 Tax=Lyophyllum shimeji TaxID=47721 RepID=A0A9P3PS41_LYOSH|nr:hypothetical protein LshimejAT787_0803700 [Lyophyllum shimeji]